MRLLLSEYVDMLTSLECDGSVCQWPLPAGRLTRIGGCRGLRCADLLDAGLHHRRMLNKHLLGGREARGAVPCSGGTASPASTEKVECV